MELNPSVVSDIHSRGGTVLGAARGYGERTADIVDSLERMNINVLFGIGGDGTQKIGLNLFKKGLKVVGVPKTIDNDLSATDVTFGFDTALHTATDAVDKIHTTAESHHRVMLVEVMGRDAGWIALETGIAGGAHIILIPEIPFTIERICEFVTQRQKYGKRFTIIVVAEGVKLPAGLEAQVEQERRQRSRAGAVGNIIGDALGGCLRRETRVTVLGHIQRGGSPSPFDRILSTRFGVAAVDLIAQGKFGRMKAVDPNGELVATARSVGIGFGD